MISAKVVLDSYSPQRIRLTTLEVRMPRIILAELNTHRMFSRSAASSRAIPVARMIDQVEADPFIPIHWGKNKAGMQAEEELDETEADVAKGIWLAAKFRAVQDARALAGMGIHKQVVNRLLEPFAWTTVLVTATEWDNFFALRLDSAAQPEMRATAFAMKEAMDAHVCEDAETRRATEPYWHLPFVRNEDFDELRLDDLKMVSAARCARVSYLNHEGKRDVEADLRLASKLREQGHMSPFEHVARPTNAWGFVGNFRGWVQLRKHFKGEAVFGKPSEGDRI